MKRTNIIAKSQIEIRAIVAERKLHTALTRKVPQYSGHIYHIAEKALVYSKRFDKWTGLHTVIFIDESMITASTLNCTHRYLFNFFQLEPYFY